MDKFLRFSVMRMGKVTQAIHELEPGDKLTVRGPYGNSFPVDEWKGKNIITIGGGIGQAPLRPIIEYVRANCADYAGLTTVYGAQTSKDLCFKGEFKAKVRGQPLTLDTCVQCQGLVCYDWHIGCGRKYDLNLLFSYRG